MLREWKLALREFTVELTHLTFRFYLFVKKIRNSAFKGLKSSKHPDSSLTPQGRCRSRHSSRHGWSRGRRSTCQGLDPSSRLWCTSCHKCCSSGLRTNKQFQEELFPVNLSNSPIISLGWINLACASHYQISHNWKLAKTKSNLPHVAASEIPPTLALCLSDLKSLSQWLLSV